LDSLANGNVGFVTQPPEDGWPTLEEPTLVTRDPAPPQPPYAPPPPPDRRIGAGMLLALGAIGLVAIGILIALLLTRDDNKQSTTVVVTNQTQPPTTTAGATTTPVAPAGAKLEVPDLIGKQASQARATLEKLGLQAALTSVTDTKPPGTVVDQQPPAGSKARKGAVVTLSVAHASTTGTTSTSTGTTTSTSTAATTTTAAPANATVPDVTGQSESAAVSALSRAGILPSLVFVPGSDPLGTVLQQAKQSGTTVPYHSHVQVNLSRGPGEKEDEQVPNVIGRTLTDAVGAVNAAHLRLIYVRFPVSTSSQVGKIVQQSPLGGGKAPQNAQVLVFLGTRAQ
jgi:eukaryotic-like serine/threonine-protein kinase